MQVYLIKLLWILFTKIGEIATRNEINSALSNFILKRLPQSSGTLSLNSKTNIKTRLSELQRKRNRSTSLGGIRKQAEFVGLYGSAQLGKIQYRTCVFV